MSPIFTVCLCKSKNILGILQRTHPMRKLQKLFILWILLFASSLSAQYTGVINSNRPGFSESPYSVGTGIYQLETSIFFRNTGIYPTFSRPQSLGVDFLFRTSFFKEKLELNANFAFQNDKLAFENIFTSSYSKAGLSKLVIAGKYLLYEQKYKDKSKEIRSWVERNRFDMKRLIPSVAIYAGVNTDFIGEIHKTGQISPKVGVLLQNDLTNDFNVVTNIFYDKIGTDFSEFSYIITGTYSFNDRWSTFFENQTFFNKFENRTSIGSGVAYLYNRNIQINSSLRLLANGKSSGLYTSLGVSYRLDRHKDKMTDLDADGNPIKEEKYETPYQKKGFFGRIFSKITGIFKKKGSQPKVKLKNKTIESIRKNTNKEEVTLNNDSLQVKKPTKIRTRPVRKRVKPSRVKSIKKKDRGGIFSIFKGKTKEEKDKAKKDKTERKKQKQIDRDKKKAEAQKKKDEARKKRDEAKKKRNEQKNEGDSN